MPRASSPDGARAKSRPSRTGHDTRHAATGVGRLGGGVSRPARARLRVAACVLAGQRPQAGDPVRRRRVGVEPAAAALARVLDRVHDPQVLGARGSCRGTGSGRASSFRSAETRPAGLRVIETEVASARYSRSRETAAWTARAASGANSLSVPANRIASSEITSHMTRPATTLAEVVAADRRVLGHLEDTLEEHVREDHDGADEERDDQAVARVEVRDVRELVCDDALELLAVEQLQQPAGDRDRRVGRVAARRRTRSRPPASMT